MLIPTVIIMLLNVYTGVFPGAILGYTNKVIMELGFPAISVTAFIITGFNGVLNPALISLMFGVGVAIAFVIFIVLKKSRKVGLMDTYTAGNFVHDEHLFHYTKDFYAPLERLYEKHSTKMQTFYKSLANKVRELGRLGKHLFMSKYVEVAVVWIIAIIFFLLWGEIL